MENTYGVVKEISPSTYSWNLESGSIPDECVSERFFVREDKIGLRFKLKKLIPGDSWSLHLQPTTIFYPFNKDVRIYLRYSDKTGEVFKKIVLDLLLGGIRNIKADILEIIFTFPDIQESINKGKSSVIKEKGELKLAKENLERLQKTLKETNEKWEERKESLHRTKEDLARTKQQWEEIKESLYRTKEDLARSKQKLGQNNENSKCQLPKSNGVDVLSGDLKNAFLSEEESDVIFSVGDQKFPAHKIIIKNRSSVFRAMLEHNMKEKNQGTIDIPDCDARVFRDFLLYLYTGKFDNISKENVFDMYYMSDKYDVIQLKQICVDHIKNNLSLDIVCDVIALATKHSEHDLLKQAINVFIENANEIFLTVKWQEFMAQNPVPANELIIKAFNNVSKK